MSGMQRERLNTMCCLPRAGKAGQQQCSFSALPELPRQGNKRLSHVQGREKDTREQVAHPLRFRCALGLGRKYQARGAATTRTPMDKDRQTQSEPHDPEEGHGLWNILKLIFLVAVLVGAWFLLDRLISGK